MKNPICSTCGNPQHVIIAATDTLDYELCPECPRDVLVVCEPQDWKCSCCRCRKSYAPDMIADWSEPSVPIPFPPDFYSEFFKAIKRDGFLLVNFHPRMMNRNS